MKFYKRFSNPILLYIVAFTVISHFAGAQDYTQTQNKIKSIYLYNFIKDIQWPALLADEEVQICLLQKDNFYTELEKLAAAKKINNKTLTLQQISSLSTCKKCDLIFIEDEQPGMKLDQECGSLIITSGFYNKSLSNIVLMFQDNKLQFSINQALCNKTGVKISAHLAALANQKIIQQ